MGKRSPVCSTFAGALGILSIEDNELALSNVRNNFIYGGKLSGVLVINVI